MLVSCILIASIADNDANICRPAPRPWPRIRRLTRGPVTRDTFVTSCYRPRHVTGRVTRVTS